MVEGREAGDVGPGHRDGVDAVEAEGDVAFDRSEVCGVGAAMGESGDEFVEALQRCAFGGAAVVETDGGGVVVGVVSGCPGAVGEVQGVVNVAGRGVSVQGIDRCGEVGHRGVVGDRGGNGGWCTSR